MTDAFAVVVAALALSGGLLVTIPVPWGGDVPLGLTLAMALPALLPVGRLAIVDLSALILVAVVRSKALDRRSLARLILRLSAAVMSGAGAAIGFRAVSDTPGVLETAALSALAVLVSEMAWHLVRGDGTPTRFRSGLPVYLTLGCAAVLFADAVGSVGVAMASAAALPLVVARVAFRRYAEATTTLRQTVQALGLVPELAGLAPIGHSERAAFYAGEIADELGLDLRTIERILTATRLHHLGALRDDDADTSPADIALHGASILRSSGFPGDVADLVEQACADGFGAESGDLEAAIVRVATAFDHAVGENADGIDRSLALLSAVSLDSNGRRAAAALLARVASNPGLACEAIAVGGRFRDAAAGLDLALLVAEHAGGQILPFTNGRG